ncbi:MAG: prephenate dehydratase [Chitinophagaceae bacterium]|nr:prephenate dehydratase [Chitinophagaceae bacterium]
MINLKPEILPNSPFRGPGGSGPGGIAIQGYEGSFHQVAARYFFGKQVKVIPCDTFRDLVRIAADKKTSDGAVMAIENSIAGSILPNYNLLQKTNLKVIGEVYLSISQNLLVNPGVKLADIREVHSHPMALLQCMDYLEKNAWKLVETEDTALSAKHLHQHHSRHAAAVASKLAAELYGMDIIAPDIQTQKNNITRFLVLKRKSEAAEVQGADKASIYFQTDHSRGILAKVLTRIAQRGINLSKLQSMPIPGSTFKYGFYADMEFEKRKQLETILADMASITNNLKIFGIYKKGKVVKG